MSWLSWHIWKKMSFFQLQINQRKKQSYSFDWIQKRFFVLRFPFFVCILLNLIYHSFFPIYKTNIEDFDFFSNLHRWQIWNVNMTWFFFLKNFGSYQPWSLWWNCGLFSSTFLWRKRFEAIYWSHLLSWFGCQAFVSKPQEFGSHVILRDFPKTIRRE